MSRIREKTKEKYDSFLEELKLLCDKKENFNIHELIKVHSVSANTSTLLMKLGHLEKTNINNKTRYNFVLKERQSIFDVTISLLEEMTSYQNGKKKDKNKQQQESKLVSNKVALSPLVDSLTDIMEIGIRYEIKKDKLKDFVKEVLSLKTT